MNFAKIFNAEMKRQKITNKKLSEILKTDFNYDISQESISKYRQGARTPNPKFIELIAKILNVSTDYLLGLKDNKLDVKKIKISGLTSCGLPLSDEYQGVDEFVYINESLYKPDIYALKCCGDSMSPEIEDGDAVVCKPVTDFEEIQNGDLVHYTLQNESAVKIFYRDEDNFFISLIPYNKNENFKTKNIRLDGEQINYLKLSKVVAIIKQNINNRQSRLKLAGVL